MSSTTYVRKMKTKRNTALGGKKKKKENPTNPDEIQVPKNERFSSDSCVLHILAKAIFSEKITFDDHVEHHAVQRKKLAGETH